MTLFASLRQMRPIHGFTLIEIAIVLVIVGLLLGGLLMPLAAQVDNERRKQTERALEEIREAIIGFAMTNGRLPCPADPALTTGDALLGEERTPPCDLTDAMGVVPWVTLGLSETDAWGRRFTYRVTPSFADGVPTSANGCLTVPPNASFSMCSNGDNTVNNGVPGPGTNVATNIPAVIVSHGKSGSGAWLPNGIQQTPLPLAGSNEIENTSVNATFVSRTPIIGTPMTEYDDLTIWIVLSILKNRLVAADRLP